MTYYEHEAQRVRLDLLRAKEKGFTDSELKEYTTILLLEYDPKPRAKIAQLLSQEKSHDHCQH